jgi:hypothetical protein
MRLHQNIAHVASIVKEGQEPDGAAATFCGSTSYLHRVVADWLWKDSNSPALCINCPGQALVHTTDDDATGLVNASGSK